MTMLASSDFEKYVAQQTAKNQPVVFDQMIFCNISGLTADNLHRYLTMPTEIAHRVDISRAGYIDENKVVYSAVLGSNVGDFEFNYIGLINKSENILAVACFTDTIKKRKNKGKTYGNSMTRNMILHFTGAKALTQINVAAESWQVDFTNEFVTINNKFEIVNNQFEYIKSPVGFNAIGQCESIAELRTIEPTEDNQRILVRGYYAGSNVGGGEFYSDLNDKTTADNSGTVIVTTNGQRWKRVYQQITPFDFGAFGNGKNNDTEAFNALEKLKVNYVNLLNGVYFVDAIPKVKIYFNGTFKTKKDTLDLTLDLLNSNVTVTVGNQGDFATINDAISYLTNNFSKKTHKVGDSTNSSKYTPDSLSATIKILSGFVMREQVILRQSKLGWINLIAEDPEVIISRESLTKIAYFEGTSSEMYPAFYAGDNSEQLLLACRFKMDETGDGTNRHGYVCNRNSTGHIWSNCGINNAGGYGCFAREASTISCRITYFEGAGKSGYAAAGASKMNAQGGRCAGSHDGVSAFGCSIINFERGVADNCKNDSIVCLSSSAIGCDYAELNNANRYGIRCQEGGRVGGYQINIQNAKSVGIYCLGGSVSFTKVNLNDCNQGILADRCAIVTVNQSSIIAKSKGIHAKNGSKVDASDSSVICGSEFSVNANFGSSVVVTNVDCRSNRNSDGHNDLQFSNGSFISARDAKGGIANGLLFNQLYQNGAVFK
ncbi:Tail fiber protein [Actinobacillus lignieresii]|uniref:phage tail-collar fiber domain-containing protein n=1 Tax=Actinobacillus lignieresii TaxID=720 RepID=UPI000E1AB6FC|nr:phage tail protein [Actinobacillus lignieresii]SUT96036.1 Tail fiber protein [Actinobacillus lignieresii]